MRPLLRTLLIWMVVLAFPLQGIAASTMLFCGPSHDRMQQATDHSAHQDASHHLSHDDPASAGSENLPDAGGFKCSACASCCSSVALPCVALTMVTAESATSTVDEPIASVPAFLTDGPDRPPRSTLA